MRRFCPPMDSNATRTDSWRSHVTEMPCILNVVSPTRDKWKQGHKAELPHDDAASQCYPDSNRPDIGHSNCLSIIKANGDAIMISQPLIDNVESWRLQSRERQSNPDASRSPLCMESCSIANNVLMRNIEIPVRDEWGPRDTTSCYEGLGHKDRHGIMNDYISYSRHGYGPGSPPCHGQPCHEVLESTADVDSWRWHIAEIPPAPEETVKPPDAQVYAEAQYVEKKNAPVCNDETPRCATSALFMDSHGFAEHQTSSTCIHGRRRTRCTTCQGAYVCSHGRVKSQCRDCGGPSFCIHGRRKTACKDCGGSLFCSHGRQKSRCKDCGGVSICGHGRRRSQCKDCGGAAICCHGRRRSTCVPCGGASVCVHARQKSRCKDCARGPGGAPK